MNLWTWIEKNLWWLARGNELTIPAGLEHPVCAGFSFTKLAESVGQCEDWVLSLDDRSRLHIHVFDTHARIHRDRWDPDRGLVEFVLHGIVESRTGRSLAVAGGIGMAAWAMTRALGDR